ncbi:MAG TPA: nuclear transport factor 2 family protein [Gammaproteobacteria bacterium]|nr:nuclear transport factor 2 family protein [Gammaproteobacteria bacterium]
MLTRETARQFSDEWEKSWNSRDIDRIIRHYADDVVLVSAIAGRILGSPEVRGIESVKRYFMKGLQAYPDLKFQVLDVLYGDRSLVLYYINQNGLKAGEFMQLDEDGKVSRMYAHYSE